MQDKQAIKKIQRRLLKKETEIVKASKDFCDEHDIYFDGRTEIMLRNAMRAFFKEGIYPILKKMWEDKPTTRFKIIRQNAKSAKKN